MSNLKNRLYNYEQQPPAGVWDRVKEALDESHLDQEFPSRIYNTEITPPANAWATIAATLENEEEEEKPRVIHLAKRGYTVLKYAAAVLVIALLTIGIVKWTGNGNNESGNLTATDTKTNSPVSPTTPAGTGSEVVKNPTQEIAAESHPERIEPAEAPAHPTSNHSRKVREAYISEDIAPETAIYAYNEHTPNLAERYVMLMTPNGIVRMSKKLGNIVCCVAGEDQDTDCKDQIKKWQEKLASSPVAPAPGNFMDILSLLSTLNENEL